MTSAPLVGEVRAGESRAGEVRVFAQYDRDWNDEADVVVVGSGPCGAVVAPPARHDRYRPRQLIDQFCAAAARGL